MFIYGDFNINFLKLNNSDVTKYKCCYLSNGYSCQNKINTEFITRRKGNSGSIIDHVLFSSPLLLFLYYGDLSLSDHKFLLSKINLRNNSTLTKTVQRINHENIQNFINNVNYSTLNFEKFYFELCEQININTNTTVTTKSFSFDKPWYTDYIKKISKSRDKFYKLTKKIHIKRLLSRYF